MTSRAAQSYTRPVSAAIAEGATTPNAGLAGALVYSTTTGVLMRWSGTAWVGVSSVSAYRDDTVNTVATSGTAQTIPAPTTAAVTKITLTSATCTLTFPAVALGRSFTLLLTQDATGGRLVTWPTVAWPGGTAPTLTTTAAKTDAFTFLSADGSTWIGFIAGKGY